MNDFRLPPVNSDDPALQLTIDTSQTTRSSSELRLLDGEYTTNVVTPMLYALARKRGGGGEFDGALHITNFRLALERTGPGEVG